MCVCVCVCVVAAVNKLIVASTLSFFQGFPANVFLAIFFN